MLFFLGQDRSYLSDPHRPAEGMLRIVCVGDSMTFGQGSLPNQTLPFQLEGCLNAALWERQVEVVNGGVCGYSIHDAWARYLAKFAQDRPDVVVVLVCDNDAELYNHREAVEEHVQRLSYLEFSELCYDPAGEHFPYFRLLLRDMAEHTAEGGPPVVVAFYDIHGGEHRDLLMPRVRDACRAAGIGFADLSQEFLDTAAATRNKHLKVSDADHHPSPLAHGIAARRLARCLIEAGLLSRAVGPLPSEAEVVRGCMERAAAAIRDGGAAGKALYLLKRTLAAKRDSRARLSLAADARMSEADHRLALEALDRTWRRSVDLSVWQGYFDSVKAEIDQFDFGLRLFDLAQWRLTKSLFVLERRLADTSLPVVGQFQLPRGRQFLAEGLRPPSPEGPVPGEVEALATRVATWKAKLGVVRDFAARCFPQDCGAAGSAGEALQEVASLLGSQLSSIEPQMLALWREAGGMLDAAGAHIERFQTAAVRARGEGPGHQAALSRAWGLLEELVGHLDFCLTAAQFDNLNLLARTSSRPIQSGLTTIQVQVTSPKCDRPFTSDEPLSLEVQVRPTGPFGRPVSDIHTIVRDGTTRLYEFALPFFVMGELRLGLERGQELRLGTVRLSNADDRAITLEPEEFGVENDGQVFRARVLVPL